MKKTVYLFPNSDFKFKSWAASLPEELFISSKGPYWNIYFSIVKYLFLRKRIVLFYRYLNVSKGLLHEVSKLTIDVLIVFLATIRIIEVRWVVHNVDKESESRFNIIVQLKRLLLSKVARCFYVTSDIMTKSFPYNKSKLRVVSFGRENSSEQKDYETKRLLSLINIWKAKLEIPPKYVGLVTNWGNKENESLRLVELLLKEDVNGSIGLVYLGKKTGIENERLLEINERYNYFLKELNVDFVVKTLDDKSVPYTLYSAATAEIPLITSRKSYFSLDLQRYSLGGTIESHEELKAIMQNYDKSKARDYLDNHSWKRGAETLVSSCS